MGGGRIDGIGNTGRGSGVLEKIEVFLGPGVRPRETWQWYQLNMWVWLLVRGQIGARDIHLEAPSELDSGRKNLDLRDKPASQT